MEVCERNTSQVTVSLDICYSSQNSSVEDFENTYLTLKYCNIVSLVEISILLYTLSRKLVIDHIYTKSEVSKKLNEIHAELQSLMREILHMNRRFMDEEWFFMYFIKTSTLIM